MRRYLRFAVPVVIFLLTLSGLLFLRQKLSPPEELDSPFVLQKWTAIKRGNPNRYPELNDLFRLPESESKLELSCHGEHLGTTFYKINSFGLRDREADAPRSSHGIIAGCSFVFGHGLSSEEMITTHLSKLIPAVNVRNISFPAGGLHTTLRYFELVDPRLFVPEEEGLFVYVMINDHLNRFLLHPSFLFWAPPSAPYYRSVDGKVTYAGTLQKYPPFASARAQGKPRRLDNLPVRILGGNDRHEKKDLEFFVAGVVELRRRYLEKFPKGRFLWVIHPLGGLDPEYRPELERLAALHGLKILHADKDFQALAKTGAFKGKPQLLPHNPHPSGANNAYFAGWLRENVFGVVSEGTVKR